MLDQVYFPRMGALGCNSARALAIRTKGIVKAKGSVANEFNTHGVNIDRARRGIASVWVD